MKFPKISILDKWLEENPNPETDKLVEKEAEEICEALGKEIKIIKNK